MSERSSLSPYHRELMLSLAYLGGLTYALTLRLLPCYSARTLQRDLTDLRELGDVEKHAIYKPGPKGRPVKLYDVWTLTDKGHAYIAAKANDQYPTKPAKLRHKRVIRHDLLAVETIVAMVERARKEGLSGLYVQCEMRLNPTERRPIPDAVVIVQFGGGFTQTDIVPWTKDPAIDDETRSRFVIEADNQTETLSVIAGKAVAYRSAYDDPEWRAWWAAQFGPLPIICWVIADKDDDPKLAVDRLNAIFRMWKAEWSDGYWIGTTQHWMEREAWAVHATEKSAWYRLNSLQTEAAVASESKRPALPDSAAQPANHTAIQRPETVAPRQSTPAHADAVAPPTAASPTPPHHVRPSAVTTASSVSSGSTQRAIEPWSGEQWTNSYRPPVYYIPDPYVPPKPTNSSPSPTYPIPRQRKRLGCFFRGIRNGIRCLTSPVVRVVVWLLDVWGRILCWLMWGEGEEWFPYISVCIVLLGGFCWLSFKDRSLLTDTATLYSSLWQQPTPAVVDTIPVVPMSTPQQPIPTLKAQPEEIVIQPAQSTGPATCGGGYVISDALNVRATPDGVIQGKLFRGQEVVLLCDQEQVGATIWIRVRAKQREGWVSKRFIR